MNHSLIVGGAALVLLGGCASVAVTPEQSSATVALQADVQAGRYGTQALVGAYGAGDISHLQIKIFTLVASNESPVIGATGQQVGKDIPGESVSAPVVFGNLHHDTTYRFRAYAYSDTGTASLISTTDAGSYADVTVTRDDRPTVAALPVKLIDRSFNGQATASSITFTGGGLTHAGSESLGGSQ